MLTGLLSFSGSLACVGDVADVSDCEVFWYYKLCIS